MSETFKTPWSAVSNTRDRYLQALFAAEDVEKLGFDLNALSPNQIDALSEKFALSKEQRQQLRAAIAAEMDATPDPL